MRKTYGNTYWGKQWLNSLNDIDFSNRLPRGRTYANKGLARDIKIQKNRITAKVQGSRRTPYNVDISIPLFSANEKAKIIQIVTGNPLFLSQLLNRELPPQLKDTCEKAGVYLFPKAWKDLKGGCSCPDWAVPCKHMASVLYLVANEIDKNPFLVFELHGFDLFKGLEGVGYTASGQKGVSILSVNSLREEIQNFEQKTDIEEAILDWEDLDFTKIPAIREGLLTVLSKKPVFFPTGDFHQVLAKSYHSIAKSITRQHKKAAVVSEATSDMDAVEEIELLLDGELDFIKATMRDSRGKSLLTWQHMEDLMTWLEDVPAGRLTSFSQDLQKLYLSYRFALKSLSFLNYCELGLKIIKFDGWRLP